MPRPKFYLQVFAGPQLYQEGHALTLPVKRPLLLISMLAIEHKWVHREHAADLLWQKEQKKALNSLRQLLHHFKKQPWGACLEMDNQHLRFVGDSDVQHFLKQQESNDYQAMLALYKGKVLEHAHEDTLGEGFAEWLGHIRQNFASIWRDNSLLQARQEFQAGHEEKALSLLGTLHKDNPLDEEVLTLYSAALKKNGRVQQARQIEEYFRKDIEALGLQPSAKYDTSAFFSPETPKSSEAPKLQEEESAHIAVDTLLIGREQEMKQLHELMARARLITILGVGGIGKSTLLQHSIHNINHAFFIPLATSTNVQEALEAIFDVLHLPSHEDFLESQLVEYLQDTHYTLALDNVEHIVGLAPFLQRLLVAAPRIRIVLTSQKTLDVSQEVVFYLSGLKFRQDAEDIRQSNAARFFTHCALHAYAHVNKSFPLEPLSKLLMLSHGSPLILKLAAGWLRLMNLEEVVLQLETHYNLESIHHDLPERQRSLQAAFAYTWQQLSQQQQQTLMTLSIWRTPFSLEAATQTSNASMMDILTLLNHALIEKHQEFLRFHEMMRRLAFERLEQDSALLQKTSTAYVEYIRKKIAAWASQNDTLAGFEDIHRIYADIHYILHNHLYDDIESLAMVLDLVPYWLEHSRLREASAYIQRCQVLDNPLAARMWLRRGQIFFTQHQLPQAQEAYEKALAYIKAEVKDLSLKKHRDKAILYSTILKELTASLIFRGMLSLDDNITAQISSYLTEIHALTELLQDDRLMLKYWYIFSLWGCFKSVEETKSMLSLAHQGLNLASQANYSLYVYRFANILGTLYGRLDDLQQARYYYSQALAKIENYPNHQDSYAILFGLAKTLNQLDLYKEALPLWEQALQRAKVKRNPIDIAVSSIAIGNSLLWLGDIDKANMHLQNGYVTSQQAEYKQGLGTVAYLMAECAYYRGDIAKAKERFKANITDDTYPFSVSLNLLGLMKIMLQEEVDLPLQSYQEMARACLWIKSNLQLVNYRLNKQQKESYATIEKMLLGRLHYSSLSEIRASEIDDVGIVEMVSHWS